MSKTKTQLDVLGLIISVIVDHEKHLDEQLLRLETIVERLCEFTDVLRKLRNEENR